MRRREQLFTNFIHFAFKSLSPRWCKVLRDLWHNKTRTMLVVLSIAVGILGIGMISGTQAILSTDLEEAYLETNPRHAILSTEPFDHKLIEVLRNMPEVDEAEGRREVSARLQLDTGSWQSLELIVIADFHELRIDKITYLDGAWPPQKQEMLMERASLDHLGMRVGQTALIQLPNGQERRLKIAGQVHDIHQIPTVFSGEVQGYITLETLESLGYARHFDEVRITVAEDSHNRGHIQAVTEQVRQKIEKSGRIVYGEFVPIPGEHWSYDDVQSMLFLLNALGILTLLLSGFLVVNTTSALLMQQIRQIGVMKTIGATARQLIGIYLGTVFLFGVLALVVAIPLSALGTQALTRYVAGLLNFELVSLGITPAVLFVEVMVGLFIPILAALYPVFSGTRITVREAISFHGQGQVHFGQSLFDQLLNFVRGLPRPLLLSLRNTFRRKGRLMLVLLTLSLASAIFVSVLSVQDSLNRTIDDAMRYWHYDVEMYFGRTYRIEDLEREALGVPGVVQAEAWGLEAVVRMRSENEQSDGILMIAPPPGTDFIDPILLDGRWLHPEDGNAVVINTELLQEEPDLRVGGTMVLKIDDRKTTWQIVGLIKQPLSGPYVYVNYPAFTRSLRIKERASNIRVVTRQHTGGYQARVAEMMEAHFQSRGYRVSSVLTTTQDRQETENELNIIVVFLLIMAVLLAVVGGLGLMGMMSINVLERTREVGVMRAIGASNGSVLQIVIIEGIVIGLLSWLIGTAVSWPLGQLLSDQVGILFLGTPASYIFSQNGALFWLGIIVFIAALASFLPAWSASRLTVRETLAYQ